MASPCVHELVMSERVKAARKIMLDFSDENANFVTLMDITPDFCVDGTFLADRSFFGKRRHSFDKKFFVCFGRKNN